MISSPRFVFVLAAVAAFSNGCSTLPSKHNSVTTPKLTFAEYEIVTGSSVRQTVLTGFFLGKTMADLCVIDVDNDRALHLQLFAFDGKNWGLALKTKLSPGVSFVDVAQIGGRDRLITFENGRLSRFDPETSTERLLKNVPLDYRPPRDGNLPHVDITRDLNGDGLDEIVIPAADGFWVFVQMKDGTFADGVKLGPPEPFLDAIAMDDSRRYGKVGLNPLTIPWYLSRIRQMDYNRDGRIDLVFWNRDYFQVHVQNEQGHFSPNPVTFTTDVPFDSDGAYSIVFGFSGDNPWSMLLGLRRRTELTVLQTITDMNGDGVADMVTHTLRGRSVLKMRSQYRVYFGEVREGRIRFSSKKLTTAFPGGKSGGAESGGYSALWLKDMDGDGSTDIIRGDIRLSVTTLLRVFIARSLNMKLEGFRLENNAFPAKPDVRRSAKANFDIRGEERGFYPAVLLGDMTGDNRTDIVVGKNRKALYFFPGLPAPDLLATEPQIIEVDVPGNETLSRLVNLNGDNKQDILLHHTSQTKPHRIILLLPE